MVDAGDSSPQPPSRFYFKTSWLEVEGFINSVNSRWLHLISNKPRSFGPMDDWRNCSRLLRQFLRGWVANHRADLRKALNLLTTKLKDLDTIANSTGLDAAGWQRRYSLEADISTLHSQEAAYWRRRGRLNWVLHGDAPSSYFMALANGRRR